MQKYTDQTKKLVYTDDFIHQLEKKWSEPTLCKK